MRIFDGRSASWDKEVEPDLVFKKQDRQRLMDEQVKLNYLRHIIVGQLLVHSHGVQTGQNDIEIDRWSDDGGPCNDDTG